MNQVGIECNSLHLDSVGILFLSKSPEDGNQLILGEFLSSMSIYYEVACQ